MKISSIFIVVVVAFVAFVGVAHGQQCISPRGFNPNICEFTASDSFDNDAVQTAGTKCTTANSNPFATYPPMNNAPQNQAACNAAMQGDGTACVNAYAKYQCSHLCATCGKDACLNLCQVLPIACPSAAEIGCFQLSHCAIGNTNCVSYNIDSSEIPSYTTTTRATTTSTTTSATTTTAGTGTGATTTTTTTTTTETSGSSSFSVGCFILISTLLLSFLAL